MMVRFFVGMLRRELSVGWRQPFVWLTPLFFFVLVAVLFAIASGGLPNTLRSVAAGVIWTAALLSALLAQDNVFRADSDSGFLEQVLMSPHPLFLFVCAKGLAHWLLTGLPLLVATPLLAVMLNFPAAALPVLLLSLPAGTLVLSFLSAFGAALTLGQKNALLMALLTLPFAAPALIFAVATAVNAAARLPYAAPLSLLAAFAVLTLTVLPPATAGVLRAAGGR